MGSIPGFELPLPTYQQGEIPRRQHTNNNNIFIVHGHDDTPKEKLLSGKN